MNQPWILILHLNSDKTELCALDEKERHGLLITALTCGPSHRLLPTNPEMIRPITLPTMSLLYFLGICQTKFMCFLFNSVYIWYPRVNFIGLQFRSLSAMTFYIRLWKYLGANAMNVSKDLLHR